jgi:hypothetical protein
MKKILLFSLSLIILFAGCEKENSPMDSELFPPKVYIVGARDQIVERDIDLGNLMDTIAISVAISGSRPLSKDVTVTLIENMDEIALYNQRNVSGEDVQYQKPADAIYSYPLEKLTIKSGQVYNTYPIHINPATLQCDSLYMIPLRLKSISDYELSDNDTTVLVRLHLKNQYSGLYYVEGVLKNTTNVNDSVMYKMSRNLVATDNGNTVRMYHFNNETKDYRPTHTFKITINSDNSLSYSTWDKFTIFDGGGTYYPEVEVYDFWYEYNNNGKRWRAQGVMYKERKTSADQEELDDWLDDHRK